MYPDTNDHSVTFRIIQVLDRDGSNIATAIYTRNTWESWHLIPVTPPVIEQPAPVYKYIDVPGRNGSIDASLYLTGKISYGDRTGTMEFYVYNDATHNSTWPERKKQILEFLDGTQEVQIQLVDDPAYVYVGRVYLKSWTPGEAFSTVTFEYRVGPYKYKTDRAGMIRESTATI